MPTEAARYGKSAVLVDMVDQLIEFTDKGVNPCGMRDEELAMPVAKNRGKSAVKAKRYTVYYLPDEEMDGYTAHIPALGIVTDGETLAEARLMARDAIEGRLAVLRELNQPIPRDVEPEHLEVEV